MTFRLPSSRGPWCRCRCDEAYRRANGGRHVQRRVAGAAGDSCPPTPCGKNGDWAYGEDSIDKEKLMASELKGIDLLAMAHEDDFSRDGLGCQGLRQSVGSRRKKKVQGGGRA